MVKRMGIPFRYSYESVYLIIIPVITNINNNHNETAMSQHSTSFLTITRSNVQISLNQPAQILTYHAKPDTNFQITE